MLVLIVLMIGLSALTDVAAIPRTHSEGHFRRVVSDASVAAKEAVGEAESVLGKILGMKLSSNSIRPTTPVLLRSSTNITIQDASTDSIKPYSTRIGRAYAVRSAIARKILKHQNDCDLPIRKVPLQHGGYKTGLGADIHIWSQDLCWAIDHKERLQAIGPWIWADIRCKSSTLGCYFKQLSKPLCTHREKTKILPIAISPPTIFRNCGGINRANISSIQEFRQATTEYLFSSGFSDLVLEEIRFQVQKLFGSHRPPARMITVHIRWGDKAVEMPLVTISEYISAVKHLLQLRKIPGEVHIYISSDDNRAMPSFRKHAPRNWNVYGDATVEEIQEFVPEDPNAFGRAVTTAERSNGRFGTASLASLAIAMESNEFVLVTGSNWSRLMDELRQSVIDPMCKKCTVAIDLRKGQW